jgi:hypothetical protein
VSQPLSGRCVAFWRSPSRKPTLGWCLIWSRRKCRRCSTLPIHPRGRESEIGPCYILRSAPGSEFPN